MLSSSFPLLLLPAALSLLLSSSYALSIHPTLPQLHKTHFRPVSLSSSGDSSARPSTPIASLLVRLVRPSTSERVLARWRIRGGRGRASSRCLLVSTSVVIGKGGKPLLTISLWSDPCLDDALRPMHLLRGSCLPALSVLLVCSFEGSRSQLLAEWDGPYVPLLAQLPSIASSSC
jgi:hypothetical protein